MKWTVEYYDQRVREAVSKWPLGVKAKCFKIIDLLEKFGPIDIGMPYVKAFGKGLFEIRAQGNEGIGRAFFCIRKGKIIIVLHGFIKKTQQTPSREIGLARKRLKEVQDDE